MENNVYTWKTTTSIEDRKILNITATVKKHNVYNGIKQTELTRCKIVYENVGNNIENGTFSLNEVFNILEMEE